MKNGYFVDSSNEAVVEGMTMKPGSKISPKCASGYRISKIYADLLGAGEKTCQWNGDWYSSEEIACEVSSKAHLMIYSLLNVFKLFIQFLSLQKN